MIAFDPADLGWLVPYLILAVTGLLLVLAEAFFVGPTTQIGTNRTADHTALAGLVLALASGSPLVEAAHFANAAAGVVVAKLGTATVSPEELLAHLS